MTPDTRAYWSLLDMVRYHVRDLHGLLVWLDHTANYSISQERHRQGKDAALTVGEKGPASLQLSCVRKHFVELELHDMVPAVDELINHLESISLGELRGRLLSIRRVLIEALEKRVFMYIPAHASKYARPFHEPTGQAMPIGLTTTFTFPTRDLNVRPFGDKVFDAFEKARYDAEEAALCIVAGAFTAAVFHIMRVAEIGVRTLGKELGLSRIYETQHPKPGGTLKNVKRRFTPIEHLCLGKDTDSNTGTS